MVARDGRRAAAPGAEMSRTLRELARAVSARDRAASGTAAVDVSRSALDLQLRFRQPVEVDRERFLLWTRQVEVDAAAGDVGGVRGDVSGLEWIRDRFAHSLAPLTRTSVDTHLTALRAKAAEEELAAASAEAGRLRRALGS